MASTKSPNVWTGHPRIVKRSGSQPTAARHVGQAGHIEASDRSSSKTATMTAAKEDVLLPQDAQAVDPSKLSALTPEVVSFAWEGIAGERETPGHLGPEKMGYGLSRLEKGEEGQDWWSKWVFGRARNGSGRSIEHALAFGAASGAIQHIMCRFWEGNFGRMEMMDLCPSREK